MAHPIVWIHGFPLSSRIYDRQLPIGVTHFAPDLPGFGSAPPPDGRFTMDDYARGVLALLDERGVERAVFAGLSMGGYVCFALGRLAPERVAGLILIDTRESADTDEGKQARYETIEKVKQQGVSAVVDSMLPKMLTGEASPALVAEARQIMMTSSSEGLIAALQAMAERPGSADLLRSLDVPALVVVGDSDTVTPPSDATRMTGMMRNASLVIIRGAAHLSNFEQPEQFNEAVSAFLAQHQL